jgi:hypothetical protein
MKRWLLVLLTALATFLSTELYLHGKVVLLMWGQIKGYQIALQEKEDELAVKRIEYSELHKEKNKWIFETIRLKEKLERYQLKIQKQNSFNNL